MTGEQRAFAGRQGRSSPAAVAGFKASAWGDRLGPSSKSCWDEALSRVGGWNSLKQENRLPSLWARIM